MSNLLHSNWEIRHSSALVLRAFLKENLEFLGFEHILQAAHITSSSHESRHQSQELLDNEED